MHNAQCSSGLVSIKPLRNYTYQVLNLMGFIALLSVSTSSLALTTIPNQCSSGTPLSSLTKSDYDNIVSNYNIGTGGATVSDNNLLKITMSKVDFPINGAPTTFSTTTAGSNSAINIGHTLSDTTRPPTAYTDIKLSFTNTDTNQKTYLTNVALNAFDIDRSVATTTTNPSTNLPYSNFDDAVVVTGESQNGPIAGAFQQGLGGAVIELSAGRYRIGDITKNCPNQDLSSLCQASFKFAQPVSSVTVRYTNSDRLRPASQSDTGVIDPTTGQQIDFRLDSYCYAPAKLTVIKELGGIRVNDVFDSSTNTQRDQFKISVNNGSTTSDVVSTGGSGQNFNGTTNISEVITLAENTTYTIAERVVNGSALGEIENYNATYTCTNATTNSTTMLPTAPMIYNASAKTRAFTLSNAIAGDNITCTITNTPKPYTFTGFVFNDNGGIADAQADANQATINSGIYNNANYFNGLFDTSAPAEAGIAGSTVKLVDCANPTTVYANQPVTATGSDIGKYSLTVPAATLNGNSNICLIEERSSNDYPIRTNSTRKNIAFIKSTYSYPNNNFGRVIAENLALVLKKSQYINNCPATLGYSSISDTDSPLTGFSTTTIENIEPGKCIAYKITATNRAYVSLANFVMQDVLQKKGVGSATATSNIASPALSTTDYAPSSPAVNENGTVTTKSFVLSPRTKRNFYFNTKYGTSSP